MPTDPTDAQARARPAEARSASRGVSAASPAGEMDASPGSVSGEAIRDEPGPVPRFDVGDDPERARRLLRLRVLLKTMLAGAACVVAFVCFSAFLSDDGTEDTLPGWRVAVGDMLPGETRMLTWDGRAVVVHRRTPEQIRLLEDADDTLRTRLRDPDSTRSEQPDTMRDALRSKDPEWFVAIGLGTDYGCPVAWLAPEPTLFAGAPWPGGFVDSCRGSRYDLAGRVYAGQYADRNLVVPPHSVDDGVLLLGG